LIRQLVREILLIDDANDEIGGAAATRPAAG
jgi:hypothetical protein